MCAIIAFSIILFVSSPDNSHDFFQYDTEAPSTIDPEKKHPLQLRAMRLGISGAAGVLLMVLSLILALYVHRRLKRRPCICVCLSKVLTIVILAFMLVVKR